MLVRMDSISPLTVRTAGNQGGPSGVHTFFGKLVDKRWLGAQTVPPAVVGTASGTPTQRAASHTPSRLAP